MANWTDTIDRMLAERIPATAAEIQARYAWVSELHEKARELLEPNLLATMPPQEVYERLRQLGVPQCPIRIAHLGRVNDAERIRESLVKLLTTPGDLAAKYRAAKFPQAGIVTLTEILSAHKPMRFVLRNTAFTRALAKVAPLYSAKALDELPYEEFLDMCRVMSERLKARLAPVGLAEWGEKHRYLLLYAVLTEKTP